MISNSVPQASVSALTSITHPLTSVTDTLATSISTLTDLTTTVSTACSTTPLVNSPNYDQVSFSSISTTTQNHSGSVVVTRSPHNMAMQPHLLSTTTIQEDSLTKDASNSSGTSETTEDDDGESPKSTEEGTLAAVLALRDQYSPGLSSSIATVSQQPPMVSLDHLWSSRGYPTVEKELRTEQVDEVHKTNETITHHSNKPDTSSMLTGHASPPTVTINFTTPTPSLHHPVVTTTATSVMPARSPSPPTVTADGTTPSQSLDNTMGKYLQLLQQKQAEENSPPTATHNSDKEEVCS